MAKILLVEDDNNLREIYEARLMAEGYDIVSARDGEEALTVAMKERPDLIISDVMMPKISGFDMLDIIRSTEETKNAKVIMMTALSQAEDKERAAKLGADRYLVKSQVTLEDVAKVAREVLAGETNESSVETAETSQPPTVAQTPTTPAPDPAPVVTPSAAPEPTSPSTQSTTPAEPIATPSVAPAPTVDPNPSATQPQTTDPSSSAQSNTSATAQAVAVAPAVAVAVEPAEDTSEESEKDIAAKAMEAIMPTSNQDTATAETSEQPIEDEQSAIAAQIESFIETNKTEPAKTTEASQPASATESVHEPLAETETPESPTPTGGATGKKVIQPISDPNASKGPDLENLLKKEEEKQQMQEIAKTLAAEKSETVEERSAEAVLKKAATNNTSKETEDDTETPQITITENGDLEVKSEPAPEPEKPAEPAPAPEPAQQEQPITTPVIPHQNGGNIDGVVQPPQSAQQTQEKVDPNSIAL